MKRETKIKIVEKLNQIGAVIFRLKNYLSVSQRTIYVIGTPEYSNMGDHAIATSQLELLHKLFPEDRLIEVTNDRLHIDLFAIKMALKKRDIITLIGGGNFGDEYPTEHNVRMTCIKNFRRNKIVIFPQTIFYSDNETGKKCLNNDSIIIKEHPHLSIMTREKKSYEFALENFPTAKIFFIPDTVLYLDRHFESERKTALICLRNDKEVKIEGNIKNEIKDLLFSLEIDSKEIDTVLPYNVSPQTRKSELDNLLKQFSSSKIVITDRLHGMIFAAITGTPCIVFPNYNYKVEGCYKTIENIKYVHFLSKWDIKEFEVCVYELMNNPGFSYNSFNSSILEYKEKIKRIVEG